MRKLLAVPFVLVLGLSACASAIPWDTPYAQNYAGITAWRVTPLTDCAPDVAICYDLEVVDGKEKSEVTFEIDRDPATGVIHVKYQAGGVKAFVGQDIRGEVEKAQMKTLGKIIPELTKAIIDALVGL